MSKNIFTCLIALSLLASCRNNEQDSSVSASENLFKSKVAIAPVIDNTKHTTSWDLSDEITYSLFYKLGQKENLQVEDPHKTKSVTRKLKSTNDPFGEDIKWVKKSFAEEEFVVFLEMLEHEEIPNTSDRSQTPQECSANLNLTARVVVVDNRTDTPQVILQEVINDKHFIPKQFNQYNFRQVAWGSDDFFISPTGMAHSQFLKELSNRIDDYIKIAKSS
ncbi:MAG: hypothetical protein FJZ57_01520 [Chlamydiae bacterium]|nr:hypothetical protein [Chlamydiota bacterium]